VVSRSGALTVTQASNAAQLPARVASGRHTDGVRDVRFSYADPAFPLPKRAIIRAIEGVTGQPPRPELSYRNRRCVRPVGGTFGSETRLNEKGSGPTSRGRRERPG
jgi:hypothetical protein